MYAHSRCSVSVICHHCSHDPNLTSSVPFLQLSEEVTIIKLCCFMSRHMNVLHCLSPVPWAWGGGQLELHILSIWSVQTAGCLMCVHVSVSGQGMITESFQPL